MRIALATLLALVLLAACTGDGAPETPVAAAADPATTTTPGAATDAAAAVAAEADAPPLPAGDFRVVAVDLGGAIDGEGRPLQPSLAFKPGDRIHAAVIGVGSSDGLTLSTRWFGPDGAEIANAGQLLVPSQPTVTTFSVSQPEPWPAGAYRLEVAINQRVVETREFHVR